MSTGKGDKEILEAVEFAMVKEYMEVGGTDEGIAKVAGLSRKVVARIREAPHYKQYLEDLKLVHRSKLKTKMEVAIPEELQIVLVNLTEAILKMTNVWEELNPKLDEVIATKRPWLGR